MNLPPCFGEALARGQRLLAEAGVPQPRRDARLLLARAAGVAPARVVAYPETRLTAAGQAEFERLLSRRRAREPVARILGRREFWSLEFQVTPAVLDPRPDSEALVEALLARLPQGLDQPRLLDLGTGSGCLLLALLSELPGARGLGIDRDPAAIEVARANARALGLQGRASFRQGDWARGLEGGFHLIASNPPYIAREAMAKLEPEVARYDPRLALDGGDDGLDAYRAIAPTLRGLLAPGGWAGLEIGLGQADAVAGLLRAEGFPEPEAVSDLSGVTRCLLVRGAA